MKLNKTTLISKEECKAQLERNCALYDELAHKQPSPKYPNLEEDKAWLIEQMRPLKLQAALYDPWLFVLNYGYTQDEHDRKEPFKSFIGTQETPEDYKYLEEVTNVWINEQLVIIPKSRQLRLTWLFCHLFLWDALAFEGRLNGMQTKNELAAERLMVRVEVIARHLPKEFNAYGKDSKRFCSFFVSDTHSLILGLPQGPDVARSHTFSNYLVDEAWLQDDLEATYTAVRPTLSSGGKAVLMCSVPRVLNKSAIFFNDLAEDVYGSDNVRDDIPHGRVSGYDVLDVYRNKNGFVRANVFYPSVPHRWTIETKNGEQIRKWVTMEEWKKAEQPGYSRIAWEREQEGNMCAGMGNQWFGAELLEKITQTQLRDPIAQGRLVARSANDIEFIESDSGPITLWERPLKKVMDNSGRIKQYAGQYVGGADVSAGLSSDGDPSTCYIVNSKTGVLVAKWKGNRRPRIFANELWKLGHYYNQAFLVVESNTHGISTLDCLWEGETRRDDTGKILLEQTPYDNLYFRRVMDEAYGKETNKLGFYTAARIKTLLIDEFEHALRDNHLKITDRELVQEMRNYVQFEDGGLGAARGHDDLVIAGALAWQGLKERPYEPEEETQLSWEREEDDTRSQYAGY